jgi:hypothetical protein
MRGVPKRRASEGIFGYTIFDDIPRRGMAAACVRSALVVCPETPLQAAS